MGECQCGQPMAPGDTKCRDCQVGGFPSQDDEAQKD